MTGTTPHDRKPLAETLMDNGPDRKISFAMVQTASVLLLTIVLCAVCAIFRGRSFLSGYNLVDGLLTEAAFMGLIACGMTFVMIAGGFDLSVGSITVVCSVVAVVVLQALVGHPALTWLEATCGVPQVVSATAAAALCAVLAGALLGSLNGALIAYLGVNPFVVTLSMMLVFRGVAYIASDKGRSLQVPLAFKEGFRRIYWGKVITFGEGAQQFSVLVPVVLFVVLFVVCTYLLRYTRFGHYTYAVGGNEQAAWLAGVNTRLVKAATYMIVGVTSALAALVYAALSNTAQADSNKGLEFKIITCVIVGGTPLGGGSGSLLRTLNGLLLLAVIENMLQQFGVDEQYRNITRGVIILTVVAVDTAARRRSRN